MEVIVQNSPVPDVSQPRVLKKKSEVDFYTKARDSFRVYTDSDDPSDPIQRRVRETYRLMHTLQTVASVRQNMEYWCRFDKMEATVLEALSQLDNFVDAADPDIDLPNVVHAFQTAEAIRLKHPNEDWLHLTGLIHDLGKVMGLHGAPQWAVGGDTFPVGCAFSEKCVYYKFFNKNPDFHDPQYNSKYGMYSPNCGLRNVLMSWGHDEYMYQVLKHNPQVSLPEEGLYIIRFHSFYPWHHAGDYMHLCDEYDMQMLPWVQEFQSFDLYTKGEKIPDVASLTPYYQSLINKYMPGVLKW